MAEEIKPDKRANILPVAAAIAALARACALPGVALPVAGASRATHVNSREA